MTTASISIENDPEARVCVERLSIPGLGVYAVIYLDYNMACLSDAQLLKLAQEIRKYLDSREADAAAATAAAHEAECPEKYRTSL